MSVVRRTYEVFVGESAPPLKLFLRENGVLIPGLATGHTFVLKVATMEDVVLFTKSSSITGQAGSGFAPLGTPNVIVQWAVADELDKLSEGTFRAQLAITDSDNRVRYVQWLIHARATF